MQYYNTRNIYVDRIQGSIPFREASRYFFRGHHLYDENFLPIKPIQYHGQAHSDLSHLRTLATRHIPQLSAAEFMIPIIS